MKAEKVSAKRFIEILTGKDLMNVIGGYDLPEVNITCTPPNEYGGRCHICIDCKGNFFLSPFGYCVQVQFNGFQNYTAYIGDPCTVYW